ncbi:MAG TPA: phosphoenolpyruvate-utilizing N-terminal domain-containing protein, partial [Thermodesulfobacteriota bacterium]
MKKNKASNSAEKTLKGIGVSPGIVTGKAATLERHRATFIPRKVAAEQVTSEVKRFEAAIAESKRQLEEVKQRILEKGLEQHSYILDVHLKLMEDRMLRDETIKMIKEQQVNTEWALKVTLDKLSDAFDAIEDEYFKERKEDIKHVVDRILRNLTGRELGQIEDLEEEVIVVAHDLSPA